ncbi:hypothetical protein [Mesorhizobium sp. M1399]|uniref:hypothetical protein n=1 Tax=Mesorhizobium sp. M1399 TaxID=2957096 RepID=UPI003336A979
MKAIGSLFGIGKPEGPSDAEKALQADRMRDANRADAESDARVALAGRATSLRKSLAYRDDRKGTLGG